MKEFTEEGQQEYQERDVMENCEDLGIIPIQATGIAGRDRNK